MTLATTTSANHGAGLFDPYRIAVLVPCFNEEAAIDKVVKEFPDSPFVDEAKSQLAALT